MKLHASGEDYLEAVLVLQKEKGMVRSVDEMCIRDRVMAVMPMWSIILVIAGIFVFAISGGLLGKRCV